MQGGGATMSTTRIGSADADELIQSHRALIDQMVRRVSGRVPRFIDRAELESAGNLGLVEAARRFDPTQGVPFGPYAKRRIQGAMLDHLRSTDWAPRSVRALAREVERAEQRLAVTIGRSPNDEEMAIAIGVDELVLSQLRGLVSRGSMVAIAYQDDNARWTWRADCLHDRCAPTPDEHVEFAELRGYVRDALHRLPERHRVMTVGYYLEGRTFEELADLLSITVSRASQLRSEAVTMMREGIEAQFVENAPPTNARLSRATRRRARYASDIAASSSWRERLAPINEVGLDGMSCRVARCAAATTS
jgi:RNA polymerase sigma factor for flagellar operon FliA